MTRPPSCCVFLLSPERQEPVRRLCRSEVQSSKRNYCGGYSGLKSGYREGVNEAGATRFEAIEAEPAAVPLLSPAD